MNDRQMARAAGAIGERAPARKALLICGVLSALLYALSDLLAGMRWDGYRFRDQTISELNAFGSPVRPLTIAFGLALYVLLIAFGVGIWRSAAGNRRLRVAGGLLAGVGVLSLGAVPFASLHVRRAEQGLSDTLHLVLGMVAVLCFVTAMGLSATAFGRRFLLYTIATIAVLLAFGAWTGMDGSRIGEGLATPWAGVKERISVYSYELWLIVLALALLREHRAASADRGSRERMPANVPMTATGP